VNCEKVELLESLIGLPLDQVDMGCQLFLRNFPHYI
jgi:hypothetical protein